MKQVNIIRRKVDQPPQDLLQRVNEHLQTLRFGTVTLVIQEGRLVQIDKKDMFRMNKNNG